MSIRIHPQEQIDAERRAGALGPIAPLLLPNLQRLYSQRAERLRTLAGGHPLADYLCFAATLADAQQQALFDNPLTLDLAPIVRWQRKPSPGHPTGSGCCWPSSPSCVPRRRRTSCRCWRD